MGRRTEHHQILAKCHRYGLCGKLAYSRYLARRSSGMEVDNLHLPARGPDV